VTRNIAIFGAGSAMLALTATLPGLGKAQADPFQINHLYVVGDSLSDPGAYSNAVPVSGILVPGLAGVPLPAGVSYSFTTNTLDNSSKVWADGLAATLGVPGGPAILTGVPAAGQPSVNAGGDNYAQGGARVNDQPGIFGLPTSLGYSTTPGTQQIDQLLAAHPKLGNTDLIAVWLGANDVFAQAGAIGAGAPPQLAVANLQLAASQLSSQIDRLVAAGAQNIIVVTVPDIGATPFGKSQADGGAGLTALTNAFNAQLLSSLQGKSAVIVDSGKLLTAIQADPAKYGFTAAGAATIPACLTPSSVFCIQGLTALPDSEKRIYADDVHPTAAAHALFAQAAFSGLQAATQTGTMAVATLTALRQQSLGLENRLNLTAFAETGEDGKSRVRQVGDIVKFGSAEGGYFEASAEQVRPGLSATTEVVKAGGDVMILPNALVGAGISYDNGQVDFDGDRGGFDSQLFIGALYGTMALSKQVYINAAGAAGYVDVFDITRSFALGAAREKYTSSTEGSYVMGRLGAGYLARVGEWIINPAAALTFERVGLDGFTESNGAASLAFGETEFYATRLTGSVTATYAPVDPEAWRAVFRASVEHDLEDDSLIVKMGPTQSNLGYVTAPRPDGTFGYLSAQLIKPLANNAAFGISGSSVVGLKGNQGFTGSATYKMKF
jgi:outer membrane lipase/esterase